MLDVNKNKLVDGSIVDLKQTVNGQNLFVILTVSPLDVRYAHDLKRVYEYSLKDLFAPCKYSGETDWVIIANVYEVINDL